MAHYLIIPDTGDLNSAEIIEATNIRTALRGIHPDEAEDETYTVWTLRGEPRTYTIQTETKTTITRA